MKTDESGKLSLRVKALAEREAVVMRKPLPTTVLIASERIVSAYHAIGSEIDPAPLMDALAKHGAQLALPVLLDRQTMVFRAWDQSRPLVPVGFGTLGPDADQPEVLPDLIFAPLAAFSATGQRIGYGKGHYDRCLAKMHGLGHHPAYLGLAFDEQEVPPFEAELHDISLDGVLTPSGLRIFEHGHARLDPFLRASEQP
ncbi:MAG: 5-formyltetrahydrofolate cyclo-ligase [Devosiaceae bacterium]